MSAVIAPPNGDVLRNRGFQIRVHRMVKDDTGNYALPYQRLLDAEERPVIDLVWFRLTNAELAAMEEMPPVGFGSIEDWETALKRQTFKTLAKTLAIALDLYVPDASGLSIPNIRLAAMMLQDGKIADYAVAMSNAMLLSQGVSPEAVGEAVKRGLAEVEKSEANALEKILKMFKDQDDAAAAANDTPTSPESVSPSDSGTPDGPSSDVPTLSSGN